MKSQLFAVSLSLHSSPLETSRRSKLRPVGLAANTRSLRGRSERLSPPLQSGLGEFRKNKPARQIIRGQKLPLRKRALRFIIKRLVEGAYTIVVPDADLLSCVCGTNDSNLKLIEEHLGVPVFTRGNELSIDDENPAMREKFRFIIDRVLDEVREGGENGRDIVSSVLASPRVNLAKFSITVPGGFRKVYPRTEGQGHYIDAMRKKDMVLCTGPAGSGKTFLAVAESLRLLLSHDKSKLVLTRPVVEAGESLGYLPGDLEQKISPYLRPLYDAMEAVLPRETVRRLVESGAVETAPLAYMRGRTLNNSVVILDEAQNTTKAQMKMFLTRLGERAKAFITGDVTQIDLPRRADSGLVHAVGLLKSIEEIGMVELCADDVQRAPLVRKIVKAYASCAAPATSVPHVRDVSSERARDNNFH